MATSVLRLFFLFLVVLLVGCAAAVVGGGAAGGYYVAKSERSAGEIVDDGTITAAINTRYVKDDLINAFDINVDTYRGTVTLYGSVPSEQAARRAVDLARAVKGVRQVESRLTVVGR
jgi:hyperosmotically inducible protein